jgi:inorganic pyrophosphatase
MSAPRDAAIPRAAPRSAGGAAPGPASDAGLRPTAPGLLAGLPLRVQVVVEVSRGSYLKRNAEGKVEYASPIPCPFNYGSVPGTIAPDGDALDALVLGEPLPRGTVVEADVHGIVRFLDHGEVDDKLVCAVFVPRDADRASVHRFFTFYTWVKRCVNLARVKSGATRYSGVEWRDPRPA